MPANVLMLFLVLPIFSPSVFHLPSHYSDFSL